MQTMSPPDEFEIRPMTAADLDAVLDIEQASFTTPWKREHFESELSGKHSYPMVAVQGSEVLGYVCLMTLFEVAQILDIAVSPNQRGRGVGQALMNRAEESAREKQAEILELEVRASSAPAISLYERCGFIRTGIRSKYYDAREDAILMEKNLKEIT